jgi:hypothetical protein
VQLRADQQDAFDTVRAVEGVATMTPRPDAASGVTTLDIEAEAGSDVRAAVARAVVGANIDLLSMTQVSMSLEEIFLELTTREGAPTEAPAGSPAETGPSVEGPTPDAVAEGAPPSASPSGPKEGN